MYHFNILSILTTLMQLLLMDLMLFTVLLVVKLLKDNIFISFSFTQGVVKGFKDLCIVQYRSCVKQSSYNNALPDSTTSQLLSFVFAKLTFLKVYLLFRILWNETNSNVSTS